ncbi:transmembrane and coiled-coil domain-containing protein 6 [Eupeodes corollae]|uniref:transmembrane and coiled-coil domain-containing protein 6 n=1 Tax=Eupeodes corollae TaxID=290404 RepID=UPI0024925F78|nr:transmembrane and coiled-coil domain-containing protein 6 [Eupeodes corollae]
MSVENQLIPTEALREKLRNYSRNLRDIKRNSENDSLRFGLGEIQSKIIELDNLTEKDVQGLANRIKRRKHASAEDMYRLSHAFLQGVENIRAFSMIPGAIQTLVKELTGSDAEQQFHASETFCNLSLGEAPVCEKIATMAGSYLVTYLDCTEERIKRTCLWTLANIIATGGKGAHVLISMEIVPKLMSIYLQDCNEDDYREDAAIVLDVIGSSESKLLRPSDLECLFLKFHMKNPTSPGAEYHLRIIFNSGIIAPGVVLSEEQVNYLMNFSVANLHNTENFEGIPNRMRILYAIRILANLLALDSIYFNILIEKCTTWNTNLVRLINRLFGFKNQQLSAEVLWLVKNIEVCQSDSFPASAFLNKLVFS